MAPKRVEAFKSVPTFAEQGADWSMGGWRGLGFRRGFRPAPESITGGAFAGDVAHDEYRDFMCTSGFDARGDGPQAFTKALARHDREFGDILTSDAFQSVRSSRFGPFVFPSVIGGLMSAVALMMFVRRSRDAPSQQTGGQRFWLSAWPRSG